MATILRTIDEITLEGVYDRGAPNAERIAYRAQRQVDLGEYIVCLAATMPDGTVAPLPDQMLWLGAEQVDAGHWIFVYTGAGNRRATRTTGGEPAVVIHWGKQQTILHDQGIVPVMFHLGGILTERSAETLDEIIKRLLPFTPPAHRLTMDEAVNALIAGKDAPRRPPSLKDMTPEGKMLQALLESQAKKSGSR